MDIKNFVCEKCEKIVDLEEKTEMFQAVYICPECKAKYSMNQVRVAGQNRGKSKPPAGVGDE